MPRSKEREGHRLTLIQAAAGYLDAGREVEATLMEPISGMGQLVITMQMIPFVDEASPLESGEAPAS